MEAIAFCKVSLQRGLLRRDGTWSLKSVCYRWSTSKHQILLDGKQLSREYHKALCSRIGFCVLRLEFLSGCPWG